MVTCPVCRRRTELPNNSARNLENSFVVNDWLEMSKEMKRRSSHQADHCSEELRRKLICSECKNQYQNPKMLNCGHTFCMECIDKQHRVSVLPSHTNTVEISNNCFLAIGQKQSSDMSKMSP